MKRPNYKDFKKEALRKKGVREEYEALKPDYALRRELIRMRQDAGLTQEDMARLLETKKASISRLESVSATHSPRLSTLQRYAEAAGFELQISFKPLQSNKRHASKTA